MITTLLFDLGNVFIFHDNEALWRSLAEASGRSLEDVHTVLRAGFLEGTSRGLIDAEGMIAFLRRDLGIVGSDADLEAVWSSHFRLHDEVMPIVESLVGRVKLVLVSNTNPLHVRYCKAALPILERFDGVVMSNEVRMAKPDAAIFHHALGLVGAAPHEAAFFDDIQRFVDAASSVGINGRLFTTAKQLEADLKELGL